MDLAWLEKEEKRLNREIIKSIVLCIICIILGLIIIPKGLEIILASEGLL
jgi:hypothetical protein